MFFKFTWRICWIRFLVKKDFPIRIAYNELVVSLPVIVDMVISTFGLTEDEAEEKVQEYLV